MRRNLDKERLLKLTLAVYRVTAIFSVAEELTRKIRESADKILTSLLSDRGGNAIIFIGEILDLFDEAEEKNLVDSRNFSVLRKEYGRVQQIADLGGDSGKTVENPLPKDNQNGNGKNGNRQEKILEVMNGNGMVKIGDIIKMFPEVNRRTVLRDMDRLCQVGAVVRNGNGRGAHYVRNGHNGSNISP